MREEGRSELTNLAVLLSGHYMTQTTGYPSLMTCVVLEHV